MIEATPKGVVVQVRVIPRAGRTGLAGTRDGALLVRLGAPPVDGAANAELLELLADTLGLPKRNLSLLSGDRSKQKRVLVTGLDVEAVRARLISPNP